MNAPLAHHADELAYEIDSWDLSVALRDGANVLVIDARAPAMGRLGFAVRELIGGLDWWKRDGHPTHGATAQAASAACGCN